MNSLATLDALCLPQIVADAPVTFGFGGVDYTGTCVKRQTSSQLVEGGFLYDQEIKLTVEVSQYGSATRPAERDTLTLCMDADGIPCATADAVATRINARILGIGRAGAGLTYQLQTVNRG
jgi:hypothetical protein